METNNLENRVTLLGYEKLVEAANSFLPAANGVADPQAVERQLATKVQQHGGQYSELEQRLVGVEADTLSSEYLLRWALIGAARGSEENKQRLTMALDGVEESQGVGGAVRDAVFAATLFGIVWLAHPPTKVHTTTTIKTGPDFTVEKVETDSEPTPPPVDELFGWIKSLEGGK